MSGLHKLAKYDCHKGIDHGSSDGRTDDCCWIDASILAAIGNDIDRNKLQRRNVDDQKGAHLMGSNGEIISPFLFKICKLFHSF